MLKFSEINDNTKVIVNTNRPISIYTFVESEDGAPELKKAIENTKEEAETWKSYIVNYPQSEKEFTAYLEQAEQATYQIMTLKQHEDLQRSYLLDTPLEEITEERWHEMLEVSPPLKWVTRDGVNEFLLSEFYTGNYTNQYARCNGKYYTKMVNAYDESTWIHNLLKEIK